MRICVCGLLALVLVAGGTVYAQQAAGNPPPRLTLDLAVLNTAAQAWDYCDKSADRFADIVEAMALLSASRRGLKIPDSREIGEMIGQIVTREVCADPDSLLYADVDHAVVVTIASQLPTSYSTRPQTIKAKPRWTMADVVTSTVNQAWELSGKSRDTFSKMVQQTVAMVMENRGLTLENSKEAGAQLGTILRVDMEGHPNDLLYSVVERSLRQVATAPTATPAPQ